MNKPYVLCKCEFEFDGRKRNPDQSGITISVGMSVKILNNIIRASQD